MNMLAKHRQRQEAAFRLIAPRVEFYRHWLGDQPRRVLEVGCGDGVFFRPFGQANIHWVGLDVNPQMVSFCQTNQIPALHADFCSFAVPEPFDVVCSSQVLEHFLNPHAFMEAAIKTLRPGGVLHLDVPNHNSLMGTVRKVISRSDYGMLEPPHHLIAYCASTLRKLIEMHGLEVVLLEAYPNDHPVFGQVNAFRAGIPFWAVCRAAALLGRGSLLVAIARVPSLRRPAPSSLLQAS